MLRPQAALSRFGEEVTSVTDRKDIRGCVCDHLPFLSLKCSKSQNEEEANISSPLPTINVVDILQQACACQIHWYGIRCFSGRFWSFLKKVATLNYPQLAKA